MPTNNPNQHPSQPTPRGAAEVAGNRIEHGGRRVEESIERFEKTAEEAASGALERVRAAKEQATDGIVQQRDQVAQRIQNLGDVLRSGSERLRDEDPLSYQVLTYASERAEGVAAYVRGVTPGGLADDLHSFARRRPGLFFGSAFLLGLAAGRFVKSSTSSSGGGDRGAMAGYGDLDIDVETYDEPPARPASAAGTRAPQQPVTRSAEPSYAAPAASTSLPYVSAGSKAMGVTSSSATYGASTGSGTSGGDDSAAPSYGVTVGGTGGYASQSATGSMVTRPGQGAPTSSRPAQPALREAPDAPPNPQPHAVRQGEGTKS